MTNSADSAFALQQPVVTFFVVGIMGVVTTPEGLNHGKDLQERRDTARLFIFLCIGLACVVFLGIVLSGYLLGIESASFITKFENQHTGFWVYFVIGKDGTNLHPEDASTDN